MAVDCAEKPSIATFASEHPMHSQCNSERSAGRQLSASDLLIFSTSIAGLIFLGCAIGGLVVPVLGASHIDVGKTVSDIGQTSGAIIGGLAGIVLCGADVITRRKRH